MGETTGVYLPVIASILAIFGLTILAIRRRDRTDAVPGDSVTANA